MGGRRRAGKRGSKREEGEREKGLSMRGSGREGVRRGVRVEGSRGRKSEKEDVQVTPQTP